MSDARLIRRFRRRDPEAVRELYQRRGGAIFATALRALGDRSLAEEAVQLTFLQAWRAAERFDEDRPLGPWLHTIARRVAIDLYRRERRHVRSDLEPEIVALPDTFDQTWETWAVRSAIDALPEGEREVVECTHLLGLSHEETAERLGIPVGTVKSRSYRAHRRLAGSLSHLQVAER